MKIFKKVNVLLILIVLAASVLNSCQKDDFTVQQKEPNEPTKIRNKATTGTLTDIDGNVYQTVTIGTQTWMAENLRTTKYRNGQSIRSNDNSLWYNSDPANKNAYGGYYDCYEMMDSRNVAPSGWHVPSQAEWTTLLYYLGGSGFGNGQNVVGSQLKEAGITYWLTPNTGATNSSGFNGRGSGYYCAGYDHIGALSYWWSTTLWGGYPSLYFCPALYYDMEELTNTALGHDVGVPDERINIRCIKDSWTYPTVSTNTPYAITSYSAMSGGLVSSDGGATVTSRGVCWSTSYNPTIYSNITNNGSGTGSFSSNMTFLSSNTTYYYRAYATNSVGTAYGNQMSFRTQ